MIDDQRQLFPFCIVWTLLPCFSWFIPVIGHTGICDSTGRIFDFLGYHINSGNMAFGRVIKYVQLFPESEDKYNQGILIANNKFRNQNHDICCNNCHHHVAYALNAMEYQGKTNWTQFDIWWLCLRKSAYVSCCAVLKVYLPVIIIAAVVTGIVMAVKK